MPQLPALHLEPRNALLDLTPVTNALDGIQKQQAQFAVEDVQIQYILKACARLESVGGVLGLERQPVGPEAVVVEMREIVQGFRAIRADQAALDQLVELLLVGERRLAELHFSAPTKK